MTHSNLIRRNTRTITRLNNRYLNILATLSSRKFTSHSHRHHPTKRILITMERRPHTARRTRKSRQSINHRNRTRQPQFSLLSIRNPTRHNLQRSPSRLADLRSPRNFTRNLTTNIAISQSILRTPRRQAARLIPRRNILNRRPRRPLLTRMHKLTTRHRIRMANIISHRSNTPNRKSILLTSSIRLSARNSGRPSNSMSSQSMHQINRGNSIVNSV